MGLRALRRLVPQAAPALRALLDDERGTVQAPVRSEIFGPQRFAQHGRSLGGTHLAARASAREALFFPRLRSNIDTLREAHQFIAQQTACGEDLSPAAQWLLDNFHLIEAQLGQIHDGLPRSYFRALPMLQDAPLAGLPRVYGVAWAFVAHTDSVFDEALWLGFLDAYQERCELKLGELWALPTTLRVVLVENLRRLAERLTTRKAAREVANLCCDRIDQCSIADLDELLALLHRRGVGAPFMDQMAQRLQVLRLAGDSAGSASQLDWLRRMLPDAAALQAQHSADAAADNLSVANAVGSLRAIGDANWPGLVERTSALMRAMLGAPAFAAEQVGTRDQTLHAIEQLARRSARSELEVAQTLLGRMRTATDALAATPGHWLCGGGRPELERALGLHRRLARLARAGARRMVLPGYLGSLLIGTLGLVAWMLTRESSVLLRSDASPVWAPVWALLGALLMLLPASEAVLAVIHRLIGESTRPRPLPRLALEGGIPPEHRVMVVIPALLADDAATAALLHRLLLHHLANPEPQAQFALLGDFTDAAAERIDGDAAVVEGAVRRIAALNQKHPVATGAPPRFILLHRPRRFSVSEQCWIGWERKRGKLEQLVAALATGSGAAFLDLGEASRIAAGTRHVLTLDSDTQLPPGRLRELVGVAAHPDNRPRLDAATGAVIGGFGILQPRVVTPLPAAGTLTVFHWLFAGRCGIDPYSAAGSEVYQDLFGEASFTGKGLLDVQAVHAALAGRLPEGQVLSHDLIEGAIARCAAVTDIALVEDSPFHADVAASRVHRWTRGDWQLLPLLWRARHYRLRAVDRWKMVDNLRRSLVAPASLALLLLSLVGQVLSPWSALALVLAAHTAGPLLGALAAFVPGRARLVLRCFYRPALVDLARTLCGGAWQLWQLLPQALRSLDAIGRALHRTYVSRRSLLQWTTAAAAQAQAGSSLAAVLRQHRSEPLVALALLAVLLLAAAPAHRALVLALCGLWATAPLGVWWVSRARGAPARAALSVGERGELEGIARDTWRFFERSVSAEDHHLPPDNLQTSPQEVLAHRTSPTNIGLYLLGAACARQFGWIATRELVERLEATLATLRTLQRHRGHFLNWYDTRTLAPLQPVYVSTVDSGNLSGHLVAVAQACTELADASGEDAQRLAALAQAFDDLAWEADYRFLYDARRRLLHIGYRVADAALDAGFYDLLASESRLASVLAIAKGDLPVAHWAALGRPLCAQGSRVGLRSWSGSMFEYLMPALVLDEPPSGLLREAAEVALREQIAFARAHHLPWGMSESAHAGRDHTLAYQYAPQGVPALAQRRTPADECVVAPYATALAAPLAPRLALRNFAALQALGARGRWGFIEALDFSAPRQVAASAFTHVLTHMAHHQGMSLVALADVLLNAPARRWAMSHPRLAAVASLLHERAPREVTRPPSPPPALPVVTPRPLQERLSRELLPGAGAIEPTHALSNGRYHVWLRPNGAGCSRWGTVGITRSRDDALRDECGSFIYLGRGSGAPLASITQHPAPDPGANYRSVFHADRVDFGADWPDLQARCTVWVSPEDDIEFRRVELHNLGDEELELELVSAFEASLADARADEAHPAFSNLFVAAHWWPDAQAMVVERRPRLATEQGLLAAHFVTDSDAQLRGLRLQGDRQRWRGRNRSASQPLADFDAPPPCADGEPAPIDTGLDPVCALAASLRIAAGGCARLTFATAVAERADTLHAVIDKHRQASQVQRASLMSATLAGVRLRGLNIGADNVAAIQLLSTALVQTLTRLEPFPEALATPSTRCDRRSLWRFGISGDRPLLLVTIADEHGLGLLRTLAHALQLWSWAGIACDLVVVSAEPALYPMALQREITSLGERVAQALAGGPGPAPIAALHVLRAEALSADELGTLRRVARVQLLADGRPLAHHLQAWSERHDEAREQRLAVSSAPLGVVPGTSTSPETPQGEFASTSGEFRFDVGAQQRPPRPWINVLANPDFGTLLSESGGGCTWAGNSRLNQLTAWSNDPVADPPSEWLVLQDIDTLEAWSVAPSAWGAPGVRYRIAHGQGHSVIDHRRGDLEVRAEWCVDAQLAVKHMRLRLTHHGLGTLRLRIFSMAEWMMGAQRADRGSVRLAAFHQRLPELDDGPAASGNDRARRLSALLCTQLDHAAGFGEGTAFLALAGTTGDEVDWTCDRREFLDARGHLVLPDHLGQRSGDGLDPCAALSLRLALRGGETVERVFLLGHADNPDAARELASRAAIVPAATRLAAVRAHWDALLGATEVRTPDPLFDAMVNRWLLYQTVSCRLWAKAGFYQAGGATGFRDQLQDAMALAWAAPQLLRQQIVRCAGRQFVEGDVQHWWHAPSGAGVRTHMSDDLLWLPHACLHYLRTTGDEAVLDERVPFIEAPPIASGAEDAYDTPRASATAASVYEHAALAIDRSLRVGAHGLPLIGSGDWNDGMNRVGHQGRGESVWLAWFLGPLVEGFVPLARARGEHARAARWELAAQGWKAALQGPGWDGRWYRRAFFDDGQPLGSQASTEARIDLIAQAWAVLSGGAPADRQRQALAAVEEELVDTQAGLIRLLWPPLAQATPSAGYIQAYPPGVRENGGQYSHAGVWALMAQIELAKALPDARAAGDRAWRDFTWLSPAHRSSHPLQRLAYGLEPYAMAGDICSQPPHAGRGGWSWYTGAAAWMHRAAIESIFGLALGPRALTLTPCLPSHWREAELTLRRDGRTLRFVLLRGPSLPALLARAPAGAITLWPGQPLVWDGPEAERCFVIPLLDVAGGQAAAVESTVA